MADKTTSLLVCYVILVASGHVTFGQSARRKRADDPIPVEVQVETLASQVSQLTAQLQMLNDKVAAMEEAVAFTVRFRSIDINLNPGQTLEFDDVIYNIGSGYNPVTGFFTAPSAGTYTFFMQVMRHASDDAVSEVGLYQGSKLLAKAHACCSPYEEGSTMVAVHLGQGESVRVKLLREHSLYGGEYTSFSGMKLSPN